MGASLFEYHSYTYDDRSRRTSQTWTGNVGDRYEYDPAGQLTKVDHNVSAPQNATGPLTADHAYDYDAMGNRELFTVAAGGATTGIPAGTTNYTANDLNQYTAISAPTTPPQGGWNYDDDGNLVSDGFRLYIWDAWNRLREVKNQTGQLIASYSYDAGGRRINKTTTAIAPQGAESIHFIYDRWNVIQEWDAAVTGSATLHAYLVWGDDVSGSKQGAGGVGGLLMRQITGGQTLYYHYDANGNPARLTNASNNSAIYRYDGFGNLRTEAGVLIADNPWKFSTKYQDQETGFSYYGYRYYDPVTGRWPSRDPIEEEGGVNLYEMVGNDSVNYTDLLGHKKAWWQEIPQDPKTGEVGFHVAYHVGIKCDCLAKAKCVCKYKYEKIMEYRLPDYKDTLYNVDDGFGGPNVLDPLHPNFMSISRAFYNETVKWANSFFINNLPRTWKCTRAYTREIIFSACRCRMYVINKYNPKINWY